MKTLFPWFIGGFVGLVISVVFLFSLRGDLPTTVPVYAQVAPALIIQDVVPFPTPTATPASPGLPVRLIISAIDIDTSIQSVGLTPDGSMGITQSPLDVAWFDLGPRPGEQGSAVIAGHYGIWKGGISAIFDNLYKLKPGDEIQVEDANGLTTTFVVRESRSYDPQADASSVFTSNDGGSHLNLITCEGVWDPVSKSYSQRLVVFTDKE